MEICFLGTGAPYPDPLRGSSAILVEVGSARILLDCGRACVQQMARLHIEPSSITHCFLTHGHYDHVADYALLVLTSWRFGRRHTLQVYGPPGTKAMSDALFQEAYKIDIAARKNLKKSDAEADININVTEVRNGAIAEGEGWRIRAIEVVHWPIPLSLGFLIEGDGKKVFFTGDTAPCDAVRIGASGVDVLLDDTGGSVEESESYADLLGMPLKIFVSGRRSDEQVVAMRERTSSETHEVDARAVESVVRARVGP